MLLRDLVPVISNAVTVVIRLNDFTKITGAMYEEGFLEVLEPHLEERVRCITSIREHQITIELEY